MSELRQHLDPTVEAPPFDYNPSSMPQRLRIGALALVAGAIALYMGFFQWGWIDSVWDPVFGNGSETVLSSEESEAMHRFIGLPDAVFGAWAYLTEAVLAFAGSTRRWQFRPWLVVLFGIDVIPLGIVSAILVVLQGVSVGAWCFLCLTTALISLVLVVMAYDEVWSALRYLHRVWRDEEGWRPAWNTFWGRPSPRAVEIAYEMTGDE
ncbi:MAG: vitamin K epoxide reductase family protein [Longimicrobiales bacterium]|nr:vitamin K epoxide reductase family protein [Longimicrobiales bacterium]